MINKILALALCFNFSLINSQTINPLSDNNQSNLLLFNYDPAGNQIKRFFTIIIDPDSGKIGGKDEIEILNKDFVNNIKVYPNPSTGPLKIFIDGNIILNEINILDIQNCIIKTFVVKTDQTELTINISELSTGTYIIQLISNCGDIFTKKIIKK